MKFDVQDFYAAIRKDKDPEHLGEGVSAETAHYLNVFRKNQRVNWNWIAFLFSPIWMLYRRLYAAYILLMTVSFILSYSPTAVLLLGLVINIGVGVLGDSLYIYFVKQAHVRNQTMNPGNIPLVVLICIHIIVVGLMSQIQFYLEPEAVDILSGVYIDA
ncbi:MAG: DUF2628 domain-containing protein [Alphaproteobacteria bacterium]|nr:DUF2628 domain-containing protein [Alphaproteobacteria bacterium]